MKNLSEIVDDKDIVTKEYLEANAGGGVLSTTFVIGNSTNHTSDEVDYLCDGTADDVQINQAIQDLPADGGEIKILKGTYNIESSINIENKDSVSIRGMGISTMLRRNSSFEGSIIFMSASYYCNISDLHIDGLRSTSFPVVLQPLIKGNHIDLSTFKNLWLYDNRDKAIDIYSSNKCYIVNNRFEGIYDEECIELSSSHYCQILGNLFNTGAVGIYNYDCAYTVISNNQFISLNIKVMRLYLCRHFVISSNVIGYDYRGIQIANSYSGVISGNEIDKIGLIALVVEDSNNILIQNNLFTGNDVAISLIDDNNITVTENRLHKNKKGIILKDIIYSEVMRNIIKRWEGLSVDFSPTLHTIEVDSFSTKFYKNFIHDNNLFGKDVDISESTDPLMKSSIHNNRVTEYKNIIKSKEIDNGLSGESICIDWRKGNFQALTLNDDVVISFISPSEACNLILKITQNSTGGYKLMKDNVDYPVNLERINYLYPTMKNIFINANIDKLSQITNYSAIFSNNGHYAYMAKDSGIYTFYLPKAWNISEIEYKSFNALPDLPSEYFTNPCLSNDGLKLFVRSNDFSNSTMVYQYSLSTAFDMSTLTYDYKSYDFISTVENINHMAIKPDVSKIYMLGRDKALYEFNLTSGNIDTATLAQTKPSFIYNQFASPISFSSDGARIYVFDPPYLKCYPLSTAWDISTMGSNYSKSISNIRSIISVPNSRKLLIVVNSEIQEYKVHSTIEGGISQVKTVSGNNLTTSTNPNSVTLLKLYYDGANYYGSAMLDIR